MRIFKKTLKITVIVLLSLVVLVSAVAGVVTYVVFTPERLTPIVVKQANKLVNARVDIENVELTFFSTFPDFGLKLNHVSVVNELSGAHRGKEGFPCGSTQSDSLLTLDALVATVDVQAYLDHKDVVIKGIEMVNPNIFAYIDSAGNANFDIMPATAEAIDTATTDTSAAQVLRNAVLSSLKIQNANLYFQDSKQRMTGSLCGLNLSVDGQYANNVGDGNISMSVERISFAMNDTLLAKDISAQLHTSLNFDQNTSLLQLRKADMKVNDITFSTSGSVQTDTAFSKFDMDLQLLLKIPSLTNLIAMVPTTIVPEAALAKVFGEIEFSGSAKGLFKDSTAMPVVSGDLLLKNIGGTYQGVPYKLDRLNSALGMLIDLNHREKSLVNIKHLDVDALDSKISASGTVRDVMGDPLLNLSIKANTDLAKATRYVPLDTGMSVEGKLSADVKTNMRLSEATSNNYEKLKVSGSVNVTGLKYNSTKDTMSASIGDISFAFETNTKNAAAKGGKTFLTGQVNLNTLRAQMGKDMRANMRKGSLAFTTSNVMDTTKLPTVHCNFDLAGSTARTDSMRVFMRRLHGVADITPSAANKLLPHIETNFSVDSLRARVANNMLRLGSGKNNLIAEQSSDTTVGFKGWKAKLNMEYKQLQAFTPSFPEMVYVDKLVAEITEEKQELHQCDIRIGESDMHLTGTIEDLLPYLDKKQTIRTNIKLASKNLDVNQLMRISEAGATVEVSSNMDVENPEHIEAIKQSAKVDTTPPQLKAIMLPTDIFAKFETDIKRATFGKAELENITGGISFADGKLILQELGVVANKKARMKLTAIHYTPRLNHLFAGMEIHFTDIDLSDLQNIIPDVDTILPMLRSFEGKVDFHLAAQTYLDSGYNVKYSTLRAASSIHGEKLVVLDNSTFSQIAKTLRFKQKDRNIIDSLDVEVVVVDNQIELYPFTITMDRYTVGIGGFHQLDMNVDYHVSLLNSPVPFSVGVDIKGKMDDIVANPIKHVKVVKPKYAATFKPQKKGVAKTAEEEIRDMIRASLRKAAEK